MERSTRLDSIKFVLIFFVVLGHMVESGTNDIWNAKVHTLIYSFHMPAFIYVSGYVFRRTTGMRKFWKSILNMLLVYGIFQVLFFGDPLRYYTGEGKSLTINGLCSNITNPLTPASVLWYLMSLMTWRIVTQFVPLRMLENKKRFLMCALAVSVAAAFVPLGRELSFQRTCAFYFYFLLGYYDGHQHFMEHILGKYFGRKTLLWTVIVFYIALIAVVPRIPDSMLVQFFSFWQKSLILPLRIVSYLWVLPLMWAVLNIIPDNTFFSMEGKHTLFYYIYHVYLVYLVQRLIESFALPSSLLFMLLYSVAAMWTMYAMRRIGWLEQLLRPIRKR